MTTTTTTRHDTRRISCVLAAAAAAWLGAGAASSQSLAGDALIEALQRGGYVLVMRHARSPRERPDPRQRDPGNVDGERQLDEHGRATMSAMGYAFRELRIPVGDAISSPAYRARETAARLGFGDRATAEELGAEAGDADWLRMKAAEPPPEGKNTILITHAPNLMRAFGDQAADMEDGEALIFRPGGGDAELVARMPIEEWAKLAVR